MNVLNCIDALFFFLFCKILIQSIEVVLLMQFNVMCYVKYVSCGPQKDQPIASASANKQIKQ